MEEIWGGEGGGVNSGRERSFEYGKRGELPWPAQGVDDNDNG